MDEIIIWVVDLVGGAGGPDPLCVASTGYGFAYCMADLVARVVVTLAILGGGHIAWELRPQKK